MESQNIQISALELNNGQIEGLPKNPRFIRDNQFEKLKKSIEDFPEMLQYRELIVYPLNGKFVVVAGNMRLRAGQELGFTEFPCKVLPKETTVERLKEITIKDNNSFGEWDFDDLANEWDVDDLEDWGVELPTDWGIEENEDEDKDGLTAEAKDDNFDTEKETITPRVTKGDIWRLGSHRLMCGDSTNAGHVAELMDGAKADIAFTSPPYGAGNTATLRQHIEANDGHKQIDSFYESHDDNKDEWDGLLRNSFKNMQDNSNVQFVNIQMLAMNKKTIIQWLADNTDKFVDLMVWNKHTCPPQMQKNVLNNAFEFVFIFDNDNATRKIRYGNFKGTEKNIIETQREQNQYADIHKAVFPVEFPSKILQLNSSAKSVLDLFGGTGTTLIAAEQLNRKCYMMELDPHYCDVIIARWEKLTGGEAVKVSAATTV